MWQSSVPNFETKRGSRSKMIFHGIPYVGNTWFRYRRATPSELTVSLQGMKTDALLQSVLVMVRIVSNPPDGRSLVMKSIAIVSNGREFLTGVMLRSWAYKIFISLVAATVIALHHAYPRTASTYHPTTDAQTPATSATSSPVLLPTVPDTIQLGHPDLCTSSA